MDELTKSVENSIGLSTESSDLNTQNLSEQCLHEVRKTFKIVASFIFTEFKSSEKYRRHRIGLTLYFKIFY